MWFDIKIQILNFKKIPKNFFQKMPKIPEFQKNAKYWISFKELEGLGNFKMNFKKILKIFFQKMPKIPDNSNFSKKLRIWNFVV